MRAITWLACLTWLTITTLTPAQAATPLPLANETLLHSARMWEARERGDLAMLALKKLIAARPDSPQALQELGELALRMGDIDTARMALDELTQRFASTMHARAFDTAFRVATRDRLQLASLQRRIELQQYADAAQGLAKLFPDGAPQGFLALEYYRIMAALPGRRATAIAGLRTLSEQHPDEPRYALALATLLGKDAATRPAGMALLTTLNQRDDIRQNDVDDALIAMLGMIAAADTATDFQPQLEAYVRRHPDDTRAVQLLASVRKQQARELAWQHDVLHALAINTDAMNAAAISATLQDRRAQDKALHAAVSAWHDFHFAVPDQRANASESQWHGRALTALQSQQYHAAQLHWQIAKALRTADLNSGMQAVTQLEGNQQTALAGELLATLAKQHPDSAWAFTTHVRWLIDHGDAKQAQALLMARPIDREFTPQDRDTLHARALRVLADADTDANHAIALLEQALTVTPLDIWLRYHLANAYANQQQSERGKQLMQQAPYANQPEVRYAQALYLDHVQASDAALAALESLPASAWTDEMRALHARLLRARQLREIEQLMAAHRESDAAVRLDALLLVYPDDMELQRRRADLDLQLDQPQRARDRLATLVAQHPDDVQLRLAFVRALMACNERAAAALQLTSASRLADPMDSSAQLSIAWRAYSLDEWEMADNAVNQVLQAQPNNTEALVLAGRIATATHRYADAQSFYARAERQQDARSAEAQALNLALTEARSSVISAGLIRRHKSGDAGISRFDSLTLPMAWRMPWPTDPFNQHLTLRADGVRLDAGSLPDDPRAAKVVGTVYAANAATWTVHNPAQQGLALGAIFDAPQWRADFGSTPLGFLLPNLVGGAAWTPTYRHTNISLGIERRAVTSSVLSYAGMRDPVTGDKFGGVTSTGLTLQLGRYLEDRSMATALKLATLTGTQVQNNRVMTWRVAADWRAWQDAAHEFWWGTTLNIWRYQRDLQHSTWGQGGYYSPQSYVSLALPLTLQGSNARWSYQLRASVAYSRSRTDNSPYYPTNPELQRSAEQRALNDNDAPPFHAGGNSSGLSFSAAARAEHRLTESLILGGELSMDRADYYHPIELSLYLRHPFGTPARLFTPPRPLRPYND